ncbi:MAG: phage tail protein [Trichormus sp. ATA11-4-KO1]|jgi:phage tail-like protein|nr:phage tail protein [Trichormus sp. ATA11-4-KO1]
MNNQWHEGRPVFNRLPQTGYQDNLAVDWLTLWVDQKLSDKADQLQTLWTKLDPLTTTEDWLDYLAFLCGLSGVYYDTKWAVNIKRQMISQAHSLWSSRGTLASIRTVLDIHEIPYTIWNSGSLRLPFVLSATFGRDDLRLYVRLPLDYQRTSREFKEAQRTLRNYAPVIVDAEVVFERFYLGFSRIGEPLFSN